MIIRRCSSSNSDALSQEKEDHPDLNLGLLAAMTTIYTIAEGAVTYPYDLVKTRQQMTQGSGMAAGSAPARTHLSTGAHLMRIRHEGGVRALYRGFGWNLMGAIPSEVVYYVGYTQVKQALLLTPTGQAQLATATTTSHPHTHYLTPTTAHPLPHTNHLTPSPQPHRPTRQRSSCSQPRWPTSSANPNPNPNPSPSPSPNPSQVYLRPQRLKLGG